MKLVHRLVGTVLTHAALTSTGTTSTGLTGTGTGPRRDQRGLSQSTEIALLTGAVLGIVAVIVVAITAYVNAKLPRP